MKYLVTGVTGQLGYDLKKQLLKQNQEVFAPTRAQMDIQDEESVRKVVKAYQPDIIIHCAAYTAVDKAEQEKEKAYTTNVIGTKNLTLASIENAAKMIYISTDYVFDGKKNVIYHEDDTVHPINIYGKTKELGEEMTRQNPNHLIARISWVFGVNGNNFVKTMVKLGQTHDHLTVVNDQVGSPTYTKDIAKRLIAMSRNEIYGTYHLTNDGYCTWNELASYIFETTKQEVEVEGITTEKYYENSKNIIAARPKNSKLSKEKLENLGFPKLPTWQEAVEDYCKVLKKKGLN